MVTARSFAWTAFASSLRGGKCLLSSAVSDTKRRASATAELWAGPGDVSDRVQNVHFFYPDSRNAVPGLICLGQALIERLPSDAI